MINLTIIELLWNINADSVQKISQAMTSRSDSFGK
jgi:hypothetical protein